MSQTPKSVISLIDVKCNNTLNSVFTPDTRGTRGGLVSLHVDSGSDSSDVEDQLNRISEPNYKKGKRTVHRRKTGDAEFPVGRKRDDTNKK